MTPDEIKSLFTQTIQTRGIKLTGYSKDVIYNWKHNRGNPPTTGAMLDVLYQLGKIKINQA